ncbi:MAG: transposase [Methylocella sp.]
MEAIQGVPPAASVLARMPLAESAQWLLRWACDADRLQSIWNLHRSRCYERLISFGTLVRMIAEALLYHRGSGRRAFEKNILAERLGASVAAAFGKLGRLPLAVSQAFLEETTAALGEVVVPVSLTKPPASLREFQPLIIDGKTIKRVEKRLKPLRGVGGGLIGGKALVGLDGLTGLALAMEANPDGDSSENLLVPGLLERLRRRVPGPRLFIADRSFGNLVQAEQFTTTGDHFLARLHSGCKFTADPARPAVTSRDETGRTLIDSWGIVGGVSNRRRRALRQVELQRGPTEETIVVITDLDDPVKYPAADLLSAYRDRHGIEMVFHKTTEVFGLHRLIGGSPLAGLFQLAFCLLLYNIVQILLGYVGEANTLPHEKISAEKLFDDARDQLIAWNILFTPEQTEEHYRELADRPSFMRHLRTILKDAWCPTWNKSKPQPNRKVPHTSQSRSHSSVHRLLEEAAETAPPAKPPPRRPTC